MLLQSGTPSTTASVTSRVVQFPKMVKESDLDEGDTWSDFLEDVKQGCQNHGTITSAVIITPDKKVCHMTRRGLCRGSNRGYVRWRTIIFEECLHWMLGDLANEVHSNNMKHLDYSNINYYELCDQYFSHCYSSNHKRP